MVGVGDPTNANCFQLIYFRSLAKQSHKTVNNRTHHKDQFDLKWIAAASFEMLVCLAGLGSPMDASLPTIGMPLERPLLDVDDFISHQQQGKLLPPSPSSTAGTKRMSHLLMLTMFQDLQHRRTTRHPRGHTQLRE